MTREERIRRVIISSSSLLRNVAFYRAGWNLEKKTRIREEFWINATSNSLDIVVLEWCKLFAIKPGKHNWKRVIPEAQHAEFKRGLLKRLSMRESDFQTYEKSMRHYRDKFVAHLDDEDTMILPLLRPARKCAAYLYDRLLADPEGASALAGVRSAGEFYLHNRKIAREEFRLRQRSGKAIATR